MSSYKEAKEAFVSQLQGGSIYQINVVSLTALTTFSLWASLRYASKLPDQAYCSYNRRGVLLLAFCVEFIILVLPIIMAVTVLSDHLVSLNAVLIGLSIYICRNVPSVPEPNTVIFKKKKHWSKRDSSDDDEESEDDAIFKKGHHLNVAQNSVDRAWQEYLKGNSHSLSISVDSSADAANASAAPPTTYLPPGSEEGSYPATPSSDSPSLRKVGKSSQLKDSTNESVLRSSTSLDIQGANSPLLKIKVAKKDQQDKYIPRNQPFLSVYRAHMMLMTIICILAVDFPAFPRQFAKCETWGTSLMDLGVGSFVFSMGIVSALPLIRSPRQRFKPLKAQLLRDIKKSFPMIILGSVRVIMVKGVEYPEHISEYGVHWNFFFTLALLPFSGTLCRPLARHVRYSILGLALSTVHQMLLSNTKFGSWAISNSIPRTTLLSQNKEGFASLPGYLAIFLLGMDLGLYLLPKDPYLVYRKPSKSRKKEKTDKLAMLLASLSILWWAAYYLNTFLFQGNVSRRSANLAYVLWITAYNTSFLLCYVVIYMSLLQGINSSPSRSSHDTSNKNNDDVKTPILLQSLNHSAFVVFLVANLLTGLINISIHTMYSSDWVAIVILIMYTTVSLALATLLCRMNWKLPL